MLNVAQLMAIHWDILRYYSKRPEAQREWAQRVERMLQPHDDLAPFRGG